MDKNKVTYESVDQYIEAFEPEVQELLQSLRKVISEAAPEAVEKISYQMPTWFLHKNLVHFAAYKTHIGFYPAPSGIEAFKEELTRYKRAKGSVQFPIQEPLPYDLITRIVRFRVEENQREAAEKRTKK